MADGVRIIGKGLKKVGELTPEYDLEIFNDIADQVEGLGEAMKKLAKEKIGNPVEEDDYYDYDFEPVEFWLFSNFLLFLCLINSTIISMTNLMNNYGLEYILGATIMRST